jgi:hypothetical protein
MLLDAKADLSPEGCVSTLRAACERLRPDAVKMLLEAGTSVAAGTGTGWPPLEYVINAKCVDDQQIDDKVTIINLLLSAGAATRGLQGVACSGEHSALEVLVKTGDVAKARDIEIIERQIRSAMQPLIAHDAGLLELRDRRGMTVLMHMAGSGSVDTTEALVEAGADVNARHPASGRSVLFLSLPENRSYTAYQQIRDKIQMLLAAGADATVCDREGVSLLMWACTCSDRLQGPGMHDNAHSVFIDDMLNHISTRSFELPL